MAEIVVIIAVMIEIMTVVEVEVEVVVTGINVVIDRMIGIKKIEKETMIVVVIVVVVVVAVVVEEETVRENDPYHLEIKIKDAHDQGLDHRKIKEDGKTLR